MMDFERRSGAGAPRPILGVVLAGGQARRMGGGDKGLIAVGARRLLERVLSRLAPQLNGDPRAIAVNANGDPNRFAAFDAPVIEDPVTGSLGPLAGILAGLHWARAQGASRIVTVAADTPFFPHDLVARLDAAREKEGAPIAIAATQGQAHPTFGLWPTALAEDLRHALVEDGVRKILGWTDRHGAAMVSFDNRRLDDGVFGAAADPFFNINTPEDVAIAEAALARGDASAEAREAFA